MQLVRGTKVALARRHLRSLFAVTVLGATAVLVPIGTPSAGAAGLGGLDISGYCHTLGFDGHGGGAPNVAGLRGAAFGPNYAYDNWGCVGTTSTVAVAATGSAPSFDDACAAQYPGSTTYAHPTDSDNPFTWNCYPVALVTSLSGVPSSVTAGADIQYVAAVQNNGLEPIAGVQVVDTLPAGTSLVSASAPGGCSGTTTVTCSLGTIGASASVGATIVVRTATTAPASGIVTDTATAHPGVNNVATLDTAVVAATPGSASGYVPPGGSITTGGNNSATLTLPNTGPGAPVTITQQATGNNFCAGPCNGTASFISDFGGYSDPLHPIDLKLSYLDNGVFPTLKDYLTSTIYKVRDNETVGVPVPDCKDDPTWTTAQKQAAAARRFLRSGTQSGIANPAPCVDSRTITQVSGVKFKVTFEILFLSDDGGFSRR